MTCPSNFDCGHDLECGNQCLVHGILLMMLQLSVKFNEVCFGTFLSNC